MQDLFLLSENFTDDKVVNRSERIYADSMNIQLYANDEEPVKSYVETTSKAKVQRIRMFIDAVMYNSGVMNTIGKYIELEPYQECMLMTNKGFTVIKYMCGNNKGNGEFEFFFRAYSKPYNGETDVNPLFLVCSSISFVDSYTNLSHNVNYPEKNGDIDVIDYAAIAQYLKDTGALNTQATPDYHLTNTNIFKLINSYNTTPNAEDTLNKPLQSGLDGTYTVDVINWITKKIYTKDAEQDNEIDQIKAKNEEQDDRLTDIETRNGEQDTLLKDIIEEIDDFYAEFNLKKTSLNMGAGISDIILSPSNNYITKNRDGLVVINSKIYLNPSEKMISKGMEIFTIPDGFRPKNSVVLTARIGAVSGTGIAEFEIDTSGIVRTYQAMSLSGIPNPIIAMNISYYVS